MRRQDRERDRKRDIAREEHIMNIRYRLRTGTWSLEITPELLEYVGMTAEEVGTDPWKI